MKGSTPTSAVFVALRRIIRAIDLRSRFLVNKFGITGPQITIMNELSAHGGISICDLKRKVHLSQATVTGIIDRLEKKDFVERRQCSKDKRRVEIWLTQQGRQVLNEAPPLLQEEFTEQFLRLEDWEQTQIVSSLQRVVAMMEARDIEATPMLATGPISATFENTKEFLQENSNNKLKGVSTDNVN